jgi:hypothetical protein
VEKEIQNKEQKTFLEPQTIHNMGTRFLSAENNGGLASISLKLAIKL